MTEPSRALVEAACACADRGVDRECHCALLRDFPGGFYDDLTNAEYMGDDSLWCDCDCHAPGPYYPDYDDDAELAKARAKAEALHTELRLDRPWTGEIRGVPQTRCGVCDWQWDHDASERHAPDCPAAPDFLTQPAHDARRQPATEGDEL